MLAFCLSIDAEQRFYVSPRHYEYQLVNAGAGDKTYTVVINIPETFDLGSRAKSNETFQYILGTDQDALTWTQQIQVLDYNNKTFPFGTNRQLDKPTKGKDSAEEIAKNFKSQLYALKSDIEIINFTKKDITDNVAQATITVSFNETHFFSKVDNRTPRDEIMSVKIYCGPNNCVGMSYTMPATTLEEKQKAIEETAETLNKIMVLQVKEI